MSRELVLDANGDPSSVAADALDAALGCAVVECLNGLPEPSAEWARRFVTWILEDGETSLGVCLRAKDGTFQWVQIVKTAA